MHILFLNPQGNFDPNDSHLTEHPDFGGQLIYVKELAIAMADAGHKVDIVTRRIEDPNWPEFASEIDDYPDYEDNPRIVRVRCGGSAFLDKERLWDHLDEFVHNMIAFYAGTMPDFATGHYADGGYCAALTQHLAGIGFTFTGHSLGAQKLDKLGTNRGNLERMEARFRFSRRIAAERLSMRRAFRIVTSTSQERYEQYAHPLYAGAVEVGDDDRFSVIPPGVNTRVFNAEANRQDAATRAMLDDRLAGLSGPFVVVSSRLDEKKNTLGVVRAFAENTRLREQAGLAICIRGIDDPFDEVDRLPENERGVLKAILQCITEANLRGRVRFLDIRSQTQLAATYRYFARTGSVFALTAFYEPFGLAPIEAAACGLACVATRNGGPSEIFADGSGILVDPFDSADIARGLLQALAAHAELSARARRRVSETYTWRNTAEGYLAVIEEGVKRAPHLGQPVPALDASERIVRHLGTG
ncbi:MAG: glycosyltransferase [Rhodospirillales bacterium]|nr:MAG: glycosyltransferase [Rhodospirillales bacterium]